MAQPLPKWLMRRYAILWKEYKDGSFTLDDAKAVLPSDNQQLIIIVLHELKKAGWLEVKDNPQDTRKSVYRLHNPENAVKALEV